MSVYTQTPNFIQWNGCICSAGQPSRTQLLDTEKQGIKVVINLGIPDADYALPDERSIVENGGMEYFAIPLVWEKPTLLDYDEFTSAMRKQSDKKVFVHCYVNYRASVFVSLFRAQIGELSVDKIVEEIKRVWTPDDVWTAFIQQAIQQYDMK